MTPNDAGLTRALQPLLEVMGRRDPLEWRELSARLEQVVEAAVPVLGVDTAGLMLLDEADLPKVAGVTDDLGFSLEAGQSETGQGPGFDTLLTGATVAVGDLEGHPEYGLLWSRLRSSGLRAVLCSPVHVSGDVVGNFNAALCRPRVWSEEQRNANEAYADVIGLALGMTAQAAEAEGRVDQLRARLAVSGHLADVEDYR